MMKMPSLVPVHTGYDGAGKPVTSMMKWGCVIEPDPSLPGYARMAALDRGSVCRGGKSYVALGLEDANSPVTIAAASSTAELNFRNTIQEPGWLGYMNLQGVPVTPTVYVTDVKRRGDSLMSGNVPAELFLRDSVYNPVFGHYIDPNTQLTITLRNTAAVAVDIGIGFGLI